MSLSDVGNLMCLPIGEITSNNGTDAPAFLIKAAAQTLKKSSEQRNWVPVIVREKGEEQYEVIGNVFIYALAKEAGLKKIWCIIADDSDNTAEIIKILSRESIPKINLSTAPRADIAYLFTSAKRAILGKAFRSFDG